MDANEMERYLRALGEVLKAVKVKGPIDLLLIGGGYMLTQVGNRATTRDVDAVWVRPDISADSEIYRRFRAGVLFVADQQGLKPSWMSTQSGELVRDAGPLPKMKLWKKFGPLRVYLPPKEFILAHKLISAREKDQADIQALCEQLGIDTREKAHRLVNKYISQEAQITNFAAQKVARLFP